MGNTWEGWQRTKERNPVHQTPLVHSWSMFSCQENTTVENNSQVWERRQFLPERLIKGISQDTSAIQPTVATTSKITKSQASSL